MKLPAPVEEVGDQTRLDVERDFRDSTSTQAERDHAGAASGTKWLGTIMPALPNEQPSRSRRARARRRVTRWPLRAQ